MDSLQANFTSGFSRPLDKTMQYQRLTLNEGDLHLWIPGGISTNSLSGKPLELSRKIVETGFSV